MAYCVANTLVYSPTLFAPLPIYKCLYIYICLSISDADPLRTIAQGLTHWRTTLQQPKLELFPARTDNPSGTAELKSEDSGNPKVGALTATCRSPPAPLGFSLSGHRKADSSFAADNSSVLPVRSESQFSLVFTSRALKSWFVRVQEKLLAEEA